MKLSRAWAMLAAAMVLAGCASSSRRQAEPENSAIRFTRALEKSTSPPGLTRVLAGATSSMVASQSGSGYRMLVDDWCPTDDSGSGPELVNRKYQAFCRQQYGHYDDGACHDPMNSDKVIFFVKIEATPNCHTVQGARVTVIEPTSGLLDPSYLNVLRAHGVKTSTDLALDRVEADERDARRRAEQEQRLRDVPLIRKIGTRVCQNTGQFIYVGFVEGMTDDKVQIRISEALLSTNTFVSVPDFHERIIWDAPVNWSLCDRRGHR